MVVTEQCLVSKTLGDVPFFDPLPLPLPLNLAESRTPALSSHPPHDRTATPLPSLVGSGCDYRNKEPL